MKKWVSITAAIVLGASLALAGCAGAGGGDQTAPATNADLIIATGGTAGTYYPLGGGMASIWAEKNEGVQVTAQSTGGSVENLTLINKGEVDLALVQNDVASFAKNGTGTYTEKQDKFKAIAVLYPEVIQLVVKADSDIKSVADLKGKTVSVGSAGSGVEVDVRLILEANGLTYDDIEEQFLSFSESADAFKNNQLDAFFAISGVPTPALQDITATNEIRLIPFEGDAVKKLQKDYPFFIDHTIAANTYSGQAEEVKTIAVQAQLIVREGLDEELTYNLTKTLFENLDQLATIHAKGKEISLDKALQGLGGDLDPGAAKYYKEKGLIK
jgi:TRAP transporter TAXI family solute receptor